MEKFLIRKALPDDAYGISFVNAHTWHATYKGLIPDKFLEMRINSIDERAVKTREFIKNNGRCLVVENTETKEIVGMMIYGPSRNQD